MSASTTRSDVSPGAPGCVRRSEVSTSRTAVTSQRVFSQIYEIPFFVALDHKREAILVAVRGTLSLKVKLVDIFLVYFELRFCT